MFAELLFYIMPILVWVGIFLILDIGIFSLYLAKEYADGKEWRNSALLTVSGVFLIIVSLGFVELFLKF